jgi:4-hydroxybenzoate polyprenyltransferase
MATVRMARRIPWLRMLCALAVELRPHQWGKNLACFAGLIFSMQLFDAVAIGQSLIAFVAFCLASSAVYVFNDLLDRERDRAQPRTAHRPITSGELPVWAAIAALALLIALAGATAWHLGFACLYTVAAYGVLNVVYSMRLKHAVIADVMCIALGFVLRVVFGVYAVGVRPTSWVVLCMFFLALFLGFGKRRAELSAGGSDTRPVLRKYRAGFLDTLLAVSAALAILCYALFTVQRNPTLVITVLPVVYCVTRYLAHVMINGRGDSPDALLMSDWRMWIGVACWLALCVGILYSDVRLFTNTTETHHVRHRLRK